VAKGLYRTSTPETGAEYAHVHYGNVAALDSISRSLYEENGYQPQYNTLPTKEEYEASRA
jgi:hypothetical protein